MKILTTWEKTLHYVNRLGVANRTMPIGWKQQVLMDNVRAIEQLGLYPLHVRYDRREDTFYSGVRAIKASHR